MEAFWSHGHQATTMQDLVNCTGVNRGGLYSTDGDKRALLLATLNSYDDRMRRKLLADLESAHTPCEAIRRLFLAFTSRVSEKGGTSPFGRTRHTDEIFKFKSINI